MTLHFRDTLERLAKRGMEFGLVRTGRISFEWDCAGRCTSPVVLEMFSRGNKFARFHAGGAVGDRESLRVTLSVPCRQCLACLKARAARWRQRASEEMRFASRTWFATLTFRPDVHTAAYYSALSRARARASDEDEFKLRCSGLGNELTKYFKRLRKNSGVPIRYLLVPERHRSGLPHYHALIHERDYLQPLRYRDLMESYGLGHAMFKLADSDDKAIRYVTKYIAKEAAGRVRASLSYGDPAGLRAGATFGRSQNISRKKRIEFETGCENYDSLLSYLRFLDCQIKETAAMLPRRGGS